MAQETPNLIHEAVIEPLTGPMPYQGRELAFKLGLTGKLVQQFTKIFMGLATIFLDVTWRWRNQPAGDHHRTNLSASMVK
ncbi:ATP-grasp domain-containing protein [Shigella flexneri]